MDEEAKTLQDYLAILKRRIFHILIPFVVLLAGSAAVAVLLPPIYRSKATVLIESQQVPLDLVQTTVTSFADERIQIIKQRVMTSSTLLDIISKYGLYREERKKEPQSVVLDRMRDGIRVDRVSADVIDPRGGRGHRATIAFTISFESKSPVVAQSVANELVTRFLDENSKTRAESASETSEFLTKQVENQQRRISEAEQKIGAYKAEYEDVLPEHLSLMNEMLNRAEDGLQQTDRDILTLEERKKYIDAQLAAFKEFRDAEKASNGEAKADTSEPENNTERQLKALKAKYVSLAAVYGPSHPDVLSVRRQIDAFEREVSAEADKADVSKGKTEVSEELNAAREHLTELKQKYSNQHPDVIATERQIAELEKSAKDLPETPKEDAKGTQPERSLRESAALISLEAEAAIAPDKIKALKERREALQSKISELEQRIMKVPQVARGLTSLEREYQNAVREFESLKAKQQSALLAENLEIAQKAEKFTLLEPPVRPEKPEKPDRIKILVLGVALSFMGGLGAAGAAEMLDSSIRGPKHLARIINRPPLVVVPFIESQRDRRRRNMWIIGFALLIGVIAIGGLFAIHTFYKPLDVLWQLILRRFGIY